MKRILQLSISIVLFTILSNPTFGQAGTIYFNNNSNHAEWVINVNELKAVRFTYTTDVVYGPPMISIYELSTDGITYNNISSISGYSTGTICTNAKTGKAKVVFNAWAIGNAVFTIQYSADNSIVTNSDLNIGGNGTITGNLTVNSALSIPSSTAYSSVMGKFGIGITYPSEKLEIFDSNTTPGTLSLRSYNTGSDENVEIGRISAKQSTVEVARIGMPRVNGTNSGSFSFWTKARSADPLTEKVRIDGNGYVGIGTATPQSNMHILKTATTNTNEIVARFNRAETANGGSVIVRLGYHNTSDFEINSGYTGSGFRYGSYNDLNIVNNTVGGDYGGINFITNAANRLTISAGGNVGIGTTNPGAKLDVAGNIQINSKIGMALNDTLSNTHPSYNVYKNLSNYSLTWKMDSWTTNGPTLWQSAWGGMKFFTNGTPRLSITNDGKVSIGTTDVDNTPNVLLTVKGTIHTKEVLVDLNAPLADYVFDESYQLMPLSQVKQYVKENNHLPEMPSAKEVDKNGLSIGEMQNKLLQKVEELTLYSIQQQEEIQLLKSEIQHLKQK
ncbi:MAG: hypothetical protein WCK78_05195 [Paludibacter sp.]